MKILPNLGLLSTMFLLSACSTQGWYEGMRESQRQACYRLINSSEVNQCLERVEEQSYHTYRREREERGNEKE